MNFLSWDSSVCFLTWMRLTKSTKYNSNERKNNDALKSNTETTSLLYVRWEFFDADVWIWIPALPHGSFTLQFVWRVLWLNVVKPSGSWCSPTGPFNNTQQRCGGIGRFSLTMCSPAAGDCDREEGEVKASKEAKALPHLRWLPNSH